MDKKKAFLQQFPTAFFADANDREALHNYLVEKAFLIEGEIIKNVSIPGAGNMNYVIRITTNRRSFILKQARPWVEKYPVIAAPIQRIHIEAAYYQHISQTPTLATASPAVLWNDTTNYIMILEDLGTLKDLSYLYQPNQIITKDEINAFVQYAATLHQLPISDFADNKAMRLLNHEHIFKIPFTPDNGLDLDGIQVGLANLTTLIHDNPKITEIATIYGELYLSEGDNLIHGDFYPGSLMSSNVHTYVLDPEFCFVGHATFDVGVFLAHLHLAQQPLNIIDLFLEKYQTYTTLDKKQTFAFAGIEIIRRLLGVAQLPLTLSISEKKDLIILATQWMLATSN